MYGDSFQAFFVDIIMAFGINNQEARDIYLRLIENNSIWFAIAGYVFLFNLFFYLALSRLTRYMNQVEIGVQNIMRDSIEPIKLVDEMKPMEDKLNQIKTELRKKEIEAVESEHRRKELVVFLAHDLKTPLTSIVAYLSILNSEEEISKTDRDKFTKISLDKALRLRKLIDEFFEITRLNVEDIMLNKETLDLSIMIEQIADEVYSLLADKQLSITVDVDDELMVEADSDKLARVFDNILRNAIAYCYERTDIEIIGKEREGFVEIIFSNKGNKIPEGQLLLIFEKFHRLDDARSSATGGAGLGLAISKEIVKLHGGEIFARSNDEKTSFIVRLPKAKEGEGNHLKKR